VANIDHRSKGLWSLARSGTGTTISAAGNSGAYGTIAAGSAEQAQNAETPVDLRDVTDVTAYITVGGVTGTPNFNVTLNVFIGGNPYPVASGTIDSAGTTTLTAGLHGSPAIVLASWGQVAWTCSGGTVTGTQIELIGR
jgi:hypothetical protein